MDPQETKIIACSLSCALSNRPPESPHEILNCYSQRSLSSQLHPHASRPFQTLQTRLNFPGPPRSLAVPHFYQLPDTWPRVRHPPHARPIIPCFIFLPHPHPSTTLTLIFPRQPATLPPHRLNNPPPKNDTIKLSTLLLPIFKNPSEHGHPGLRRNHPALSHALHSQPPPLPPTPPFLLTHASSPISNPAVHHAGETVRSTSATTLSSPLAHLTTFHLALPTRQTPGLSPRERRS